MSVLEALAQQEVINRYQAEDIREYADTKYDGNIDKALADFDVDEQTILDAKSEYYGVPKRSVNARNISYDTLKYIPEDSAHHYKFVPIGLKEGVLEVGVLDPSDNEGRNALQFIASKNNIATELYVITPSDFDEVFQNYQGVSQEVNEAAGQLQEELLDVDNTIDADGGSDITKKSGVGGAKIVEDAPVTKTVAVILRHAVEGRASDVHIEHTGDKVKVRFRVDGTLHTSLFLPKSSHSAIVARIKILAKLKLDEKRKPQDGRFHAKIDNRKVDFRVSTLPTYHGEKVVIRILDPEKGVKDLDKTGMRPDHVKKVQDALKLPYGLILITGPTGSGKTTTLYSMLKELDREGRNVVSLEDPIEYNIEGMNQSQVRPEIGYTFANGLRSILRQDPDVIMVGEIRDKETAGLAIQAALTGHLVFATLHTNNSIGVIPRLIDMDVDPYLIAPTLVLSMAQRLTKRLCPDTGKPIPVEGSIKQIIDKTFETAPEKDRQKYLSDQNTVYEIQETPECPNGIKGRTAVFEMFRMNKDLERAILNDANEAELETMLYEQGMLSMKQDAIIKALHGEIPFSEISTL